MAQMKAWGYPMSVEDLVVVDPEETATTPGEEPAPEDDDMTDEELLAAQLADDVPAEPADDEPTVEDEADIPETLVVVDGTVVAATSHIDLAPVEEDEPTDPAERHLTVVPDPIDEIA